MSTTSCAAIDLGASNGRVVVAETDGERITLREAHRFPTPTVRDVASGYQCWDVDAIEAHVREGLRAADALAPLASAGVDTWGVDHALLDAGLARVAPVVSYRDDRTQGMMERVFEKVPADEIYRRTGIQFQPFNTLYQLAAVSLRHPEWMARARRILLLPDYFHFRLCGALVNEYTEATTTQLLDVRTGDWDQGLLEAAGVPRGLLTSPVRPGTVLGELAAPSGGGRRIRVITPATHDTASAVAACPLSGSDEAFISSGTWSLMGVESLEPLADVTARRLNFSNEGGVERRFRVLKNIVGLWLNQRIAQELGGGDAAALGVAALEAAPWRSLIDPEDPRFLNPPSMIEAIRSFCAGTGQPAPQGGAALARCALESLALSYRRTAEELAELRGRPIRRIRIVGGGCQNRLLDQLCADACQLPVSAGPVETSALGNACVQLIALGAIPSIAAARALVERSFPPVEYTARDAVPEDAWRRFRSFTCRPPGTAK